MTLKPDMRDHALIDFLLFGAELDSPERTYIGFDVNSLPYLASHRSVRERVDAPRINQLLEDAIRRALTPFDVSRIRVGILLSGGIDSANLLALLRRCGVQDVRAYTWEKTHAEPSADAQRARMTARHFGIEHHTFFAQDDVEGRAAELLDQEIGALKQPLNYFETVMMASLRDRAKADGCSLLLYGQNADTLWMSYPAPIFIQRLFRHIYQTPLVSLVSPMMAMAYFKSNATLAYLKIPFGYWQRLNRLYQRIRAFDADLHQSIILMEEMFTESRIRQLNECFVLQRTGMTVVNPYYDPLVVNAALQVSQEERAQDRFGKTMLHDVARLNGVPEEIVLKGKKGLSYGYTHFLEAKKHLPLWDSIMKNPLLDPLVRLKLLRRRRERDAYVLERLYGLHKYLLLTKG